MRKKIVKISQKLLNKSTNFRKKYKKKDLNPNWTFFQL